MKHEKQFTLQIKYCSNCKRMTVHAMSKTGTFWSCACGEIIRVDTMSPIRGANFNYLASIDYGKMEKRYNSQHPCPECKQPAEQTGQNEYHCPNCNLWMDESDTGPNKKEM